MREIFHGELAKLGAELASQTRLVSDQLRHAMAALLDVDLQLAERVISGDDEADRLGRQIEHHACELLVLQSPVAKRLRTVVCAIRAGERLERMGDLARHVAEIARLRHTQAAVPVGLSDRFAEMGRLALEACHELEHAIVAPDVM